MADPAKSTLTVDDLARVEQHVASGLNPILDGLNARIEELEQFKEAALKALAARGLSLDPTTGESSPTSAAANAFGAIVQGWASRKKS